MLPLSNNPYTYYKLNDSMYICTLVAVAAMSTATQLIMFGTSLSVFSLLQSYQTQMARRPRRTNAFELALE